MQTLEKRTADARPYVADCTQLLDANETIVAITSITSDQGGLVFGMPAVNAAMITYANNRRAQVGKAVLVEISGGAIPPGQLSILCIVRIVMATTLAAAVEATVVLRLINTPGV